MVNSYKEGDIVVFPEAGVQRLGKFIKTASIGDGEYAEVRCDGRLHIVNMDYLKPHGKPMDKSNPNRAFRIKKMTPLPLTGDVRDIVFGREVIESVKQIRMATGVGLKEAREAIAEAEWDAQVAIERIKFKQSSRRKTDVDTSEDWSDLTDDMAAFLDDMR